MQFEKQSENEINTVVFEFSKLKFEKATDYALDAITILESAQFETTGTGKQGVLFMGNEYSSYKECGSDALSLLKSYCNKFSRQVLSQNSQISLSKRTESESIIPLVEYIDDLEILRELISGALNLGKKESPSISWRLRVASKAPRI